MRLASGASENPRVGGLIYSSTRARAALGSPGRGEGRAVPTLVPNSPSPTVAQHHLPSAVACCKVLIGNDG